MHGTGNDYIYIDCRKELSFDPRGLSVKISKRRFSVGADGIILLLRSDYADAKMRIFNADGTEAEMCGNGIRCFALFAMEQGAVPADADEIRIETNSGIHIVKYKRDSEGKISSLILNMKIPGIMNEIYDQYGKTLSLCGRCYVYYPISVGNPHCVVFVDSLDQINIVDMYNCLNDKMMFAHGVNLEIVENLGDNKIKMMVFERGSGITQSCGTGAVASAYASVLRGFCKIDKAIIVDVPGGVLSTMITSDNQAYLEGHATVVYKGI